MSNGSNNTVFAISAFGVTVNISANRADRVSGVRPFLPLGWKPARPRNTNTHYALEFPAAGGAPHVLRCNGKKIVETAHEESLLERFESEITIHVADASPLRTFVHAGVVAWRGRAIVIPGRSFSGKSTLVSELVRAGAVYYSDEYAIFDRHGRVHPYPRDLQLRREDLRQLRYSPETFGCKTGRRSLPLGTVLVTRYREDGHFRPRHISAGRGILELFNNTVSARRFPEQALFRLQTALRDAVVLRGVRGEAAAVVDRLLS